MSKIKPIKCQKAANVSQSGFENGKIDHVLFLVQSGTQIINDIEVIIENKKSTEIDNTAKLIKVNTEAKKEENRHIEEMAKIEQEYKKITNAAEDRKRRHDFIQEQIKRFQAEYDRYLELDEDVFISDSITTRLDGLRDVIFKLTQELNRA